MDLIEAQGPGVADAGAVAAQLAGAAGTSIAGLMGGETPAPVAAARARLPRISIAPVEGAPGDGRESLRLALIQVMFERGVARDDSNP
ncbi:hypothetical protein, partial [Undibacterium luofuense]|uniref:hypothetical protein n=1 Tax=Undibacterium luofuense TaxID=2828733 RepID=UPI0030EB976D